ncbi:hypothetical protein GCM10008020_22690 [Massilia psychrophila]|jgi:hypothetical protein|nr:hypothetical protein GCM10008020_22690 [Massilia psychrophila]
MLLVQFLNAAGQRRVGILQHDTIREIDGVESTLALAQAAIAAQTGLEQLAASKSGAQTHAYADVVAGGRLLAPLDHPDPAHCYVTGTGLTHLGSADTRDSMHKKLYQQDGGEMDALSDSMKMFRMGVEGGRPAAALVSRRNGSTRATARSCAPAASRSRCPSFRSTAAKSRRSPACT